MFPHQHAHVHAHAGSPPPALLYGKFSYHTPYCCSCQTESRPSPPLIFPHADRLFCVLSSFLTSMATSDGSEDCVVQRGRSQSDPSILIDTRVVHTNSTGEWYRRYAQGNRRDIWFYHGGGLVRSSHPERRNRETLMLCPLVLVVDEMHQWHVDCAVHLSCVQCWCWCSCDALHGLPHDRWMLWVTYPEMSSMVSSF